MPNPNNFWAGPNGSKWQVKREGNSSATSLHDTQAKAWEEAKRRARLHDGQAFRQKRDGIIRTEHTYGDDPFPPKG